MTSTRLLIGMSGIARLAGVRRPVVSVWRRRFSDGDASFPRPVRREGGRELFDADEVAGWLTSTSHGSNPEAALDAAAHAFIDGLEPTDGHSIAEIEALVVVRALAGGDCELDKTDDVLDAAQRFDPDDLFMARELRAQVMRGLPWSSYAVALIDAMYSPAAALERLERAEERSRTVDGADGPTTPDGRDFLCGFISALAADDIAPRTILLADAGAAGLVDTLLGGDHDLGIKVDDSSDAGRSARRRLAVDERTRSLSDATVGIVRVMRLEADENWDRVDDAALALGAADRAVVIGPAAMLTGTPETRDDDLARSGILRTGKVRTIVRLPEGLVSTAPRHRIALWVLDGSVPPPAADRVVLVADLSAQALGSAAEFDLTTDVLAALGSRRDVTGHVFGVARARRTAQLIAGGAELVPPSRDGAARPVTRQEQVDPAVLVIARTEWTAGKTLDDLLHDWTLSQTGAEDTSRSTLGDLASAGHARVLSGTRLDPRVLGATGLRVIGASEVRGGQPGARRVDALAFTREHPRAQLTHPGDVVFVSGPTPRAIVDAEGSSVVEAPARILRIRRSDSGGLVAAVLAGDIANAVGSDWRRWFVRRVPSSQRPALTEVLDDLDVARRELERRLAIVERTREGVIRSVTTGRGILIPPTKGTA